MVNVLATIDLNDLDYKPQSQLFNAIAPLRKEVFDDNDRIVFKCTNILAHTYNDLPADVLIRLQKMLSYVDISNFFCVVISNTDLSAELEYVCKHYAVNENPIKNIVESTNV